MVILVVIEAIFLWYSIEALPTVTPQQETAAIAYFTSHNIPSKPTYMLLHETIAIYYIIDFVMM